MTDNAKRWTVQDRDSNSIYLTEERWQHITDSDNHPEMQDYEDHLKTTLKNGRRQQEPLNPRKYRYIQMFDDLAGDFNQLVVIVLFDLYVNEQGNTISNNFVATAFLKFVRQKGGKK